MNKIYKNILLTGKPGIGKTTVIRKVMDKLTCSVGGFYTQEIREHGTRVGFKIASLNGKEGILAHVNYRGKYRVSKYGVNLTDLENIGVRALEDALEHCELIIMDEIGRMETFSGLFTTAVIKCLDADKPVLGTIQKRSSPFLDSIRTRKDVDIIEVDTTNRVRLPEIVLSKICKLIN